MIYFRTDFKYLAGCCATIARSLIFTINNFGVYSTKGKSLHDRQASGHLFAPKDSSVFANKLILAQTGKFIILLLTGALLFATWRHCKIFNNEISCLERALFCRTK